MWFFDLLGNLGGSQQGIGGFSTFSGGCCARDKNDGGSEMVVVAGQQ
jgi:hypothetical protein